MGERDLDRRPPGLQRRRRDRPPAHPRPAEPRSPTLLRPRPPARLPRGRADPGRRVPRAPGWSTRSSPTSRRCCSAPAAAPSPTSESPPSPRRCVLRVVDVTVLGPRSTRTPNVRLTLATRKGALMFTGIVEELGTVAAVEDQGDADPAHDPRDHRRSRTPASATRSRSTAAASPSPSRDGDDVDRRRHAGDARQDLACAASGRATGSTWSARSPPTPGSAATSSRATSTAPARSSPATPSEHWEVVEIEMPADAGARTSSTRARSPSTASASPSSRPQRRPVHRQPDPRDPRPHHARRPAARRPGQPRGRHHRQVRREAARPHRCGRRADEPVDWLLERHHRRRRRLPLCPRDHRQPLRPRQRAARHAPPRLGLAGRPGRQRPAVHGLRQRRAQRRGRRAAVGPGRPPGHLRRGQRSTAGGAGAARAGGGAADGGAITPRWATGTERGSWSLGLAAVGYAVAYAVAPADRLRGVRRPRPGSSPARMLATYGMARGWVEFWLVWIAGRRRRRDHPDQRRLLPDRRACTSSTAASCVRRLRRLVARRASRGPATTRLRDATSKELSA